MTFVTTKWPLIISHVTEASIMHTTWHMRVYPTALRSSSYKAKITSYSYVSILVYHHISVIWLDGCDDRLLLLLQNHILLQTQANTRVQETQRISFRV